MATETYNQLRTWIDSIFNKNGRKFISGLLGNEGLKRVLAKAEELFNSLGIANGIATLGDDGKVPATQLPSYVDDVLEFTDFASFPATGETGKIYLDTSENTTYRWTGTTYIQIGSGNDGEANTASNVGTSGVGIFKQKSGVDLQFKKLLAGDNITLTATANDEIEVKADGGGGDITRNYVNPTIASSVLTLDFATKNEVFATKSGGGAIVIDEDCTIAYSNDTNFKSAWLSVEVQTASHTITFPANHKSGDYRWDTLVLSLAVGFYQISIVNNGAYKSVLCSEKEV